uniref:Cytochrome P450 n=1 Tax=Anopheles maculatus TaxID=74869 RepID=A0A182T8F7_9DIPT
IIDQRTRAYPGIHRIWNGSTPEVRINKAEYVEKLISSSRHIEKSTMYKFLSAWLGQGLLTSKDDRWFQHRRLITPTFHFNILDGFCEVFAEHGQLLVEKLSERVSARGKQPINVYPFITKAALDIICETAMGVKVNAQTSGLDNPYVAAVYDLSALIQYRVVRPWLHPDFIWNRSRAGQQYHRALAEVHGYSGKVIRERRAELKQRPADAGEVEELEDGRKRRLAFLDMLLRSTEQSNLLSDDDVREEVDTFMFE